MTVVIPVHGQWKLTKQCLRSLKNHTEADLLQVVVVDNASPDDTATDCLPLGKALFGDNFAYTRLERNINFGPASNLGAKNCSTPFLFFLNNDTTVTQNWLAPMLETFDREPRLAAVGPLLTYPGTDRVQHLGIAFDPDLQVLHAFEHFPVDHPVVIQKRSLQAITAAALLVPSIHFERLGGFYSQYINGFEDLDLCCRFKGRGFRIMCVPKSRIEHHTSSTPGRFDHDTSNQEVFKKRCQGCFTPDHHRLVREANFELALTPWLTTYVRLPLRQEESLQAEMQRSGDPLRLEEAIWRQPLWEAGYDRLAELYAKQNSWDNACRTLFYAAFFFPSLPRLARLFKAAGRNGQHQLAAACRERMERIDALLAHPAPLLRKADILRRTALDRNEKDLAALYGAWTTKYGQHAKKGHKRAGETGVSS